jgi:hypothetical protein
MSRKRIDERLLELALHEQAASAALLAPGIERSLRM